MCPFNERFLEFTRFQSLTVKSAPAVTKLGPYSGRDIVAKGWNLIWWTQLVCPTSFNFSSQSGIVKTQHSPDHPLVAYSSPLADKSPQETALSSAY